MKMPSLHTVPQPVFAVCHNIYAWEAALRRFEADLADGLVTTVVINIAGTDKPVPAYEFKKTDGRKGLITQNDVRSWKSRVALLAAEAEKRLEGSDWEWFGWVSLYGDMKTESISEDLDERFGGMIEEASKIRIARKKATAAAAEARKKIGNKTRELVEKTGTTAARTSRGKKISDRHLRRLNKKK